MCAGGSVSFSFSLCILNGLRFSSLILALAMPSTESGREPSSTCPMASHLNIAEAQMQNTIFFGFPERRDSHKAFICIIEFTEDFFVLLAVCVHVIHVY